MPCGLIMKIGIVKIIDSSCRPMRPCMHCTSMPHQGHPITATKLQHAADFSACSAQGLKLVQDMAIDYCFMEQYSTGIAVSRNNMKMHCQCWPCEAGRRPVAQYSRFCLLHH